MVSEQVEDRLQSMGVRENKYHGKGMGGGQSRRKPEDVCG